MKEWAAQFYGSVAWRVCRQAFLQSRGYLCERCKAKNRIEVARVAHHRAYLTRDNIHDPCVTLSWENLEALCQDCHNKEHHAAERQQRYSFDDQGRVVQSAPPRQAPK